MNKKITQFASLILVTLFIAACGNKGDLFLPETPAAKATEAAAEAIQQDNTTPEKK